MSNSHKLGYRPDIEGLRAVAVLLVVIFHFHLVPGISSGFMGVDVFFVISGFLITSIIRRQLHAGTFSLGTFWIHRIRRLGPALIATTLLTLWFGWLRLLPTDFEKLAQQTIAAQLYVANIFYWRNVNYFGLQADEVYLLHTWSLAVEEQFYIFYPLLLLVLTRWAKGRVVLAIVIAALVSFGLNLAFVASKPEATFYLMPTRAWELLAGALLAIYVERQHNLTRLRANLAGLAGVACLIVAIVGYREGIAFPGWFAVLPTMAGVLLILGGSHGSSVVSRLLGSRPLTDVGKISYPLYLVHWQINVFATAEFGADYIWGWRASMLVLSFVAATSMYHGIERPSRRWLEANRLSTVAGMYAASLVGVVALSVFILKVDGVPSRYSDAVVKVAAYANDAPPPLKECQYVAGQKNVQSSLCRLGMPGGEPAWFVFGDSHAWAASGALDEWLKQTGQSASFAFVNSCPPLRGVHLRRGPACFSFNNAVFDYLGSAGAPTNVLLISTWMQVKEGRLSSSEDLVLSPHDSLELFTRQLAATIGELKRMGKSVYIWEPVPGARERVPEAMARNMTRSRQLVIAPSREEYFANAAFFFDALREQRSSIAGTFSPSKELCGSGTCLTDIDGVPVYFDNGHLTYTLRGFWADALKSQISMGQTSRAAR